MSPRFVLLSETTAGGELLCSGFDPCRTSSPAAAVDVSIGTASMQRQKSIIYGARN